MVQVNHLGGNPRVFHWILLCFHIGAGLSTGGPTGWCIVSHNERKRMDEREHAIRTGCTVATDFAPLVGAMTPRVVANLAQG